MRIRIEVAFPADSFTFAAQNENFLCGPGRAGTFAFVADKFLRMNLFVDNAQKIFDVAQADTSGSQDQFALMIRPDGGLHFMMHTPLSLEAAAMEVGAQSAYLVTKSRSGVRVEGRRQGESCVFEKRHPQTYLLRDQPLYRIA